MPRSAPKHQAKSRGANLLRKFTPEVEAAISAAADAAKFQLAGVTKFEPSMIQTITGYIYGFFDGYVQVTGAIVKWSKGDDKIAMPGYHRAASVAARSVFAFAERHKASGSEDLEGLAEGVGGAIGKMLRDIKTPHVQDAVRLGGTDGMRFAKSGERPSRLAAWLKHRDELIGNPQQNFVDAVLLSEQLAELASPHDAHMVAVPAMAMAIGRMIAQSSPSPDDFDRRLKTACELLAGQVNVFEKMVQAKEWLWRR
jgi:hypothetical protein